MREIKIKITRINAYAARLSKVGRICPTSEMVRKLEEPPRDYVEVESLLNYLRHVNREYNEDNFVEHEAVDEFIHIVAGVIKEKCSPEELEWI